MRNRVDNTALEDIYTHFGEPTLQEPHSTKSSQNEDPQKDDKMGTTDDAKVEPTTTTEHKSEETRPRKSEA